jgi:hypothetical protein
MMMMVVVVVVVVGHERKRKTVCRQSVGWERGKGKGNRG